MLPLLVAMALLAAPEPAAEEPLLTFHGAFEPVGSTPPAGHDRLPSLGPGPRLLDVRRETITTALPICFTITPASETVFGKETFELTLQIGNGESDPLLAWTKTHVGTRLALVLDGVVVSGPVLQSPIGGRTGVIVGDADLGVMVRKRMPTLGEC